MIVAIYGSYPELDWNPLSDLEEFQSTCYEMGRYFAECGFGIVVTSEKKSTADFYVIQGFINEWLKSEKRPEKNQRCLLVMADRPRETFMKHISTNPFLFRAEEAGKRTRFDRHLIGLSQCDLVVVVGGNDHTSNAARVAEIGCKPVIPVGTFGGAGRQILIDKILEDPDMNPFLTAIADNISALLSATIAKIDYGPQSERDLEVKALTPQVAINRSRLASEGEKSKLRFLVLATEWESGHGGLSTFNRLFCYALAKAGAEVVCLVLDASETDRNYAQDGGVIVLKACGIPGSNDRTALLSRNHPDLPQDFAPDYIVGHGRVTGPAALVQLDHFPSAQRLHFIHTAPDEIEWHKQNRESDAGKRAGIRTGIEVELGHTANRAITVGPRLHERFQTELSPYNCYPPIRLDPGFDHFQDDNQAPPPGSPHRVLFLGRVEDWDLKGLDIAASAMGNVVGRRDQNLAALELVIRGAPEGTTEEIRQRVLGHAGTTLNIVVREYSPETQTLKNDISKASLVLMPSRCEGFGLVGLEVIVAGIPVLLSDQSGIAALLKESLNAEELNQFVIRMNGADVIENWSRGIEAVLRDRKAAFISASILRKALLKKEKTWAAAIDKLLRELECTEVERQCEQ